MLSVYSPSGTTGFISLMVRPCSTVRYRRSRLLFSCCLLALLSAGCSGQQSTAPLTAIRSLYVSPEVHVDRPWFERNRMILGSFVGAAINRPSEEKLGVNLKAGTKPLGDVLREELIAELTRTARFRIVDAAPSDAVVALRIEKIDLAPAAPYSDEVLPTFVVELKLYDDSVERILWQNSVTVGVPPLVEIGPPIVGQPGNPPQPRSRYLEDPVIAYETFARAVRFAVPPLVDSLVAGRR